MNIAHILVLQIQCCKLNSTTTATTKKRNLYQKNKWEPPASVVSIGYGWTVRGFESRQGKKFSSPKYPDRIRGPSSVLFNGNRDSFLGLSVRSVNLITLLHLVPRLRMSEEISLIPQYALMALTDIFTFFTSTESVHKIPY